MIGKVIVRRRPSKATPRSSQKIYAGQDLKILRKIWQTLIHLVLFPHLIEFPLEETYKLINTTYMLDIYLENSQRKKKSLFDHLITITLIDKVAHL